VLFLSAGWAIAAEYIMIIQYAPYSIKSGTGFLTENFIAVLILTFVEVFSAGLILAIFEVFYFTDRFRNKSFGSAVLIKTFFYSAVLITLVFVIAFIESVISESFSVDFFNNIAPSLLLIFFTYGPVILLSIFILQVSDKYGQGVLLKFILGKYHSPAEETRIFMFLDLKSSTSIAEELGNVKYYELLNDFYYDVTDAIIETKGEIYQYVGDEIVVSWEMENGMEDNNCLNCFFNIQNTVTEYSGKYQSKYGVVPVFKAAIHYGTVSVGEIGVLKREIVFTGDVLNTTSRIQELCNKYNEKLIISRDLLDLLDTKTEFITKEIGHISLRGRAAPMFLLSVHKTNS
jgi:adenylate cyclase